MPETSKLNGIAFFLAMKPKAVGVNQK